ncbi:endonuclease/exonuclease/phosphatase family protein [Candidatus Neomarinimicrobiota bacterium]
MKKLILIIIILLVIVLLSVLFLFKCKQDLEQQNQSITIASWNLKNIGQSKLNDPARINVIIDVLKKYDIIAIQEVKDVSLQLPQLLIAKMNQDGSNFNVVASDRVGRNVFEQYLFIYNDEIIDAIPNTDGYGIEPNDEFAREPFYTMFKSGNFDFYLMTIHTDPDDVGIEIPALRDAYLELQNITPKENDIILLGDLNGKAPGVTAGSYITMDAIAQIPNIIFTINEETNTRGGKAYDNIIFQKNYTLEYSNSSGVNTFWLQYGLDEDQGFKISDHKLVWAIFNIPTTDDD